VYLDDLPASAVRREQPNDPIEVPLPLVVLDDTARPDGRLHRSYLAEFEPGCDLLHDLGQRCKTGNSRRATAR